MQVTSCLPGGPDPYRRGLGGGSGSGPRGARLPAARRPQQRRGCPRVGRSTRGGTRLPPPREPLPRLFSLIGSFEPAPSNPLPPPAPPPPPPAQRGAAVARVSAGTGLGASPGPGGVPGVAAGALPAPRRDEEGKRQLCRGRGSAGADGRSAGPAAGGHRGPRPRVSSGRVAAAWLCKPSQVGSLVGWGFFFFLFIYLNFNGTSSLFRPRFAQCCSRRTV